MKTRPSKSSSIVVLPTLIVYLVLRRQFIGGTLAAALVGYLALVYLLRIIKHGKFYLFSPYCWVVGLLALIFSWL